MKKLSEFLAKFITTNRSFAVLDEQQHQFLELVTKCVQDGLEAYKKHLHDDVPKTAGWKMIEKNLITALDRMEAPGHAEKRLHEKS